MTLHSVRLGSPRRVDEGVRLGTVRRPPRGVAKADFARLDYYDVWLPTLAPSQALLGAVGGPSGVHLHWALFERRFRAEMKIGDAPHVIAALAALSHGANLAVGCYCENEALCHRSLLRDLFAAQGASLA